MPNPIINRRVVLSRVLSPYTSESLAVFAAMTTAPSTALKGYIDTFIRAMKADGNWALIDALWVKATETQQGAILNWKNPGTYSLTEVNSPTWTANQGYTGDGSTSYLNTGFDCATNGVNYTLNSGCIGVYCRTNSALVADDMGCNDGSNYIRLISRYSGDTVYARINNGNAGAISVTNTSSLGTFSVARTGSTAFAFWKNGTSIGSSAAAATSIPSKNIYIMAHNANGTASGFINKQYACAFIGSGSINQSTLHSTINAYMTSLGTNVV